MPKGGGRNTHRTQARISPISSPSLQVIIALRHARGVSSSLLAHGLLPPACGIAIGEEPAEITVKEWKCRCSRTCIHTFPCHKSARLRISCRSTCFLSEASVRLKEFPLLLLNPPRFYYKHVALFVFLSLQQRACPVSGNNVFIFTGCALEAS